MKKFNLALALVALAALLLAAAAPITYTQGPDTQWRQQVDPTIDPKTSAVSAWQVTAMFQAQFTNNADPADTFLKQLGTATIDCVKDAAKTVTYTVGGKTITSTYGELAAGMAAAGAQEWAAAPKASK